MATEQNELGVKISTNVDEANKKLDKLLGLLDKGANKTDKFSKSADNIKRAFNFGTIYSSARKFFELFNKGIDNINKYSETLNMFHLVMGDLTTQADKFQNTMAEAFGNNTADQLEFQSYFQSLTESMGLQEKYAYIISENMSKLTYDLSSLFDKEQKDVATALRAGLVGQTKPVRNFGMDITENSLQPILDSLGIDRTVRQLSQVEKEIVRYIALLRQSSIAHGDMANTIESPANQLRIFKNQLAECSRWFGALFINLFAKAIPYINAFLMVLKEVMRALATMFGIKIQDYNSGIATFNDYFDDTADSVAETTKNVKELRRQTLKFDEINNINENNSNSGSGGAGGVAGGIDQRLLDAITGYDNGMEKVRMKATQIRDKIMQWLGFTKKINPLTGEISWEYEGIKKTLSNMWKSFLKLNTQGKIFVALGLAVVIGKIITKVKSLITLLGTSGLLGSVKKLITPFKNLKYAISTEGLSGGLDFWSKTMTGAEKLTTTLIGVGGLLVGWSLVTDAMREFNKTGEYTTKTVLTGLAGGLTNVMSGALIGATFGGGIGAVIGGVVGAVATLVEVMANYKTELQKSNEKIKETAKSFLDFNKSIDENTTALLNTHNINEEYVKELQNITDENGNIKKGYEERANFILGQLSSAYGIEYSIVDGQIQKYKELIGTINDTIEMKKAEIFLDANEKKYANSLSNRTDLWNKYVEAQENVKNSEAEFNKLTKQAWDNQPEAYKKSFGTLEEYRKWVKDNVKWGQYYYKEVKNLKESEGALEDAKTSWFECINDIITYEDLWNAKNSNNLEEIQKALEKFTLDNSSSLSSQISMWKSWGDRIAETTGEVNETTYSMLDTTISTLKSQSQSIEGLTDEVVDAWSTLSKESKDKYLENIETLPDDVEGVLLTKQTETIDDITPEIVDAWGQLATNNHDEFVKNINTLPKDVKKELLGEMEDAGYDVGLDMNKGIKNSKTEIDKTTEKIGNDIPEKTKSKAKEKSNKSNFWSDFWSVLKSGLSSGMATIDFSSLGGNVFSGIIGGLNKSNSSSAFSGFANGFIKNIKNSLGIHSPSKLAKPIGMYTFMGIEKGMEEEIPNVEKTAYKLLNTLETTFDDGMYDLSLKSAITPNLTQDISNVSTYSAKTNIDYNVLEQASYNGFSRAIKQYGLVNINVKQDKGSIVETAIEGINDITRQTGENPIDLW